MRRGGCGGGERPRDVGRLHRLRPLRGRRAQDREGVCGRRERHPRGDGDDDGRGGRRAPPHGRAQPLGEAARRDLPPGLLPLRGRRLRGLHAGQHVDERKPRRVAAAPHGRGGAWRRNAHRLRCRPDARALERADAARTRVSPDVGRDVGDARHGDARRWREGTRRRSGRHGLAPSPLRPEEGRHGLAPSPLRPEEGRVGGSAGGRLLRLHEQDRPRLPQAPCLVERELSGQAEPVALQHVALPVRQARRRLRAEAGDEGRRARARVFRDRRAARR